MAAWTYACKTIQGMDLDMKILSRPGIPLKITRGMTGAGRVNPTQLVMLTDVADPVQEVELHKIAEYPGENKVMLPVMLKNSGITARYSMYQLGLYAEDPDKGEILYLILQSDGPEEVPAEDEMKDFTLEWYLTLSVSNTENVEIVLDDTGHATFGDLAMVENRVAVIEEFNRNMIELSDKEVEDIFKWPEEADLDEGSGTSFVYFAKNSLKKLVSLIKGYFVSNQRKINGKMLDRDITLTAEDVEAVPVIQKGVAGGVAELDGAGKVLASQLPSFVDDVLEGYLSGGEFYGDEAHKKVFAQESGKIYVDLPSGKTYRWSGSAYVVISETLALGETSGTAYRGDFGKAAYTHSQSAHAPANAEQNVQSDWNVTNTTDDAFIKNKPTIPTSLPANGGNADTVDNKHASDLQNYNNLTNKPTIPAAVRVKGGAESNYRTGDVNLTPANIGALSSGGGSVAGKTYFVQGTSVKEIGNGAGTSGYFRVCQIKVTKNYLNQFITFVITQRERHGEIYLKFSSVNTTDPGVGSFTRTGNVAAYIHKAAAGTWNLYVQKTEAYDNMEVVALYKGTYQDGIQITWINDTVTSVPGGFLQAGAEEWKGTAYNAKALDNVERSKTGARWYCIPFIEEDGVMEVGKYIDFHESSGDTGDYNARLACIGNKLYAGGSLLLHENNISSHALTKADLPLPLDEGGTGGAYESRSALARTLLYSLGIGSLTALPTYLYGRSSGGASAVCEFNMETIKNAVMSEIDQGSITDANNTYHWVELGNYRGNQCLLFAAIRKHGNQAFTKKFAEGVYSNDSCVGIGCNFPDFFKNIYEIKKVFCLGCTVLTNGFNNTQVYAIANSGFSYRIWASYSSTPTDVTFLGGFLVIATKK